MQHKITHNITLPGKKQHRNLSFLFTGNLYPSLSSFEDPNQCPMQPYYHPYSSTPKSSMGPIAKILGGVCRAPQCLAAIILLQARVLAKPACQSHRAIWMKRAKRCTCTINEERKNETFLIDLWVEYNDKLESNQNQKYWVTIQEHLNKRFKLSWSVTQIQWEICYLKEQFAKANDKLNKLNRQKQKKQPTFW